MSNQNCAIWINAAVECLINAYKMQPNLYVVKHPNYHNKHLRGIAVDKVVEEVKQFRPGTTKKEVGAKFHALRNNFNNENNKVKETTKSGAGTDEVSQIVKFSSHNLC